MTQGVSIKSSLANSFIFRGVLFLVKIKNSLTSSLIFSLLQLVVTQICFNHCLVKWNWKILPSKTQKAKNLKFDKIKWNYQRSFLCSNWKLWDILQSFGRTSIIKIDLKRFLWYGSKLFVFYSQNQQFW